MVILGVFESEVSQVHSTAVLDLGDSVSPHWGLENYVIDGNEDIYDPVIMMREIMEPVWPTLLLQSDFSLSC